MDIIHLTCSGSKKNSCYIPKPHCMNCMYLLFVNVDLIRTWVFFITHFEFAIIHPTN